MTESNLRSNDDEREPVLLPPLPPLAGLEFVEQYDYVDESAGLLSAVGRYCDPAGKPGNKTFRQAHLDGRGAWVWNLNGVRRVLYRLPRVLEHIARNDENAPLFIVEGERDVLAIERAGGVATCNPGGAGKWTEEYSESLQGARRVFVVPDRDEVGRRHAAEVVASLARVGVAAEVFEAAEGKDASDHLAGGLGLDELVPVDLGDPPAEQPFTIRVYTTVELAELEIPESAEQIAGPFVRRGMETLLGGLTGHGKTTLIAHMVKAAVVGGEFLGHDVSRGAHVLVLDLEQHLATIQRVTREVGLDQVGGVDYAPIPEGLALEKRGDQLAALERLFAAGAYDLVVVDPFYKLHESDSSDELQARLLVALLRGWINQYGFGLLTATHCRKLPAGRNAITLDDLFGSSLFTRDAEVILGLQRHGEIAKLHIFKSREPGLEMGQTIELLFSRERGYFLKPTVDPAERATRLEAIGNAAVSWIEEHPGESTNKVKRAVGSAQKCGGDLVEEALRHTVSRGLLPEPLEGSRNAKLWHPLNHAASTSPATLLSEVTEPGETGHYRVDLPRPSDLYEVETEGGGEVDEAEVERLAELARDTLENT